MDLRFGERRFKILKVLLFGFFAVILLRLWDLQILKGDQMRKLSEQNRIRIQRVYAPRGLILDRHGRILAETRPSFNLYIIPEDIVDFDQTVDGLSRLIGIEREEIVSKLSSAKGMPSSFPVKIKSDLSMDEVAKVEVNRFRLPGVSIQVEPKRYYPYGEVLAHLIGYVGEVSPEELSREKGYFPGSLIGKYGLEKEYESYLRGVDGERKVEVDAHGREVRVLETKDPIPGNNLHLNIDLDIQMAIFSQLAGRAGASVVMEAKSGEVLALVSKPSFDPNILVSGVSKEYWRRLLSDPRHPLQNRAIQGRYPPGSTFKLVVALAGIDSNLANERTNFMCKGGFRFGNRVFGCWKEKGHGSVCMKRAIVESCNVFFYNLGLKLGVDRIHEMASKLGLTEVTGIDLPGEKRGFVPSSGWKMKVFGEKWYEGETVSVAIGQGQVWLTPIGLASLASTIGNEGVCFKPRIVSKIVSPEGKVVKEFKPEISRQIKLNNGAFEIVKRAMWGVVNEPSGTAHGSKTDLVEICGKTGTAQTTSLQRASKGDHAWFVAFAPYNSPELALSIIVEYGGKGSRAAATIAKVVAEEYFGRQKTLKEARLVDR